MCNRIDGSRSVAIIAGLGMGLLALAVPASAQEAGGVPAGVIVMPGADAVARAGLDGPSGRVAYVAGLPDGTPDAIDPARAVRPVGDFVEALTEAYWTNPALLSARARLRSADFRMPQARALSGPRLSGEVGYGYLRNNTELLSGSWLKRSGWTSTASAVLTQPVFTFGRNAANERQAAAHIAYQRAVLRSTESEVLLSVIQAYSFLMRDRSALGIYRDDLTLLERELADNSGRFAKREVTISDVQQVDSRVELARAQIYGAERSVATGEAAFLSIVGLPPGLLAAPNPLTMPVASLEDAYAYAEQHSPVITAAYARERISRGEVDFARSDMLPRVDLRGQADYGSVSPYTDDLRSTQLSARAVVTVPLFESGLRRARLQEAQAGNDADWRLIDQALRDNRAEVAAAWNEWLAQTASIGRYKLASESARQAFDGALLQEKAGLRSTLDVLSLARELLVARTSYNAATASAYVAQARLLAAIGALEQSWLMPDAERYDPDQHYDRTKDDGMIPLIVPILRQLDAPFAGGRRERPVRDPAGPLASEGVNLPVPEAAVKP